MLARGSGFDANDNPLWNEYPDVYVKDEHGQFRGYRLDGGFLEGKDEPFHYLTEHVGMRAEEATSYLLSLDVEVWDDFFGEG